MIAFGQRLFISATALIFSLFVAGMSAKAEEKNMDDAPVRCEIKVTTEDGMTTLEALAHTDIDVVGSYSFSVAGTSGGGSNDTLQSGGFFSDPGATELLGQVSVPESGTYNVKLVIKVDDLVVECTDSIGQN